MAITILNQPADKSSVNNELLYVVFESVKAIDPVTYADYKYIANIYVNAVLAGTIKASPDPINYFGLFDVADILRSYLSYGLDASATVVDYQAKVTYQVSFTEEYN